MTKRTFGLLSTLSVLSIGAFTAALVLAYPNPDISATNQRGLSDTRSLDMSRSIANTSAPVSQGKVVRDTSSLSVLKPEVPGSKKRATEYPVTSTNNPTTQPKPIQSSQPTTQQPTQQQTTQSQQTFQPQSSNVVSNTLQYVREVLPLY